MLESENLSEPDYVPQQAMSLNVEDRAYVLAALEESLKTVEFEIREISAALAKETEQRAKASE